MDEVDHDGVELSIQASDDEFTEENENKETDTRGQDSNASDIEDDNTTEPGELSSSDENDASPVKKVKSKVSKVS